MKTALTTRQFLCPECGLQQSGLTSVGTASRNGVRREYICPDCHFEIPAHLAERWGGISVEDTQNEWREVYRPLAGH